MFLKTLFVNILFVFSCFCLNATTYYVSNKGNDHFNTGLSKSNAWETITHAATQVEPGDRVLIRAGNYGGEKVKFPVSGTVDAPITFEGCSQSWGTISADYWINKNVEDIDYDQFIPNVQHNSTLMPLLDNESWTETAIEIFASNITIKNIQITRYQIGVRIAGAIQKNNIIENVLATRLGDPWLVKPQSGTNNNNSGYGLDINASTNNTIRNCVVINAIHAGVQILRGSGNTIENTKVYCNNDDDNGHLDENGPGWYGATDYYIVISGSDNIVNNCYVERIGDLGHSGHGIDLKGAHPTLVQHNKITNCTIKNMGDKFGFELNGPKTRFNRIENCTTYDCGSGFLIRDGANKNAIIGCVSYNPTNGITFFDSTEFGNNAGNLNVFTGCQFLSIQESAINFWKGGPSDTNINTPCENNSFINCTFIADCIYNTNDDESVFNCERANDCNRMIKCLVCAFPEFKTGNKELHFMYKITNFQYCPFPTPNSNTQGACKYGWTIPDDGEDF